MTAPHHPSLILHGAIITLIGLFSGLIYWQTIIRDRKPEVGLAWRIAHVFLVMEGLFMIILGLCVPHLVLNGLAVRVFVWMIAGSGYGFAWAFVGGAWKGCRGLTPRPFGFSTLLFLGHVIGAAGSLVGVAMMIYGFLKSF